MTHGCEVAEVSVNTYDDSNVLPNGATCAIGEATGSIGGPPICVAQQPVTVPAGETSVEMPMLAGEAGWTCDVLVIREA